MEDEREEWGRFRWDSCNVHERRLILDMEPRGSAFGSRVLLDLGYS